MAFKVGDLVNYVRTNGQVVDGCIIRPGVGDVIDTIWFEVEKTENGPKIKYVHGVQRRSEKTTTRCWYPKEE